VDFQLVADDIISYILRAPNTGASEAFLRDASAARRAGKWDEALGCCDTAQQLAFGLETDTSYVAGVANLCRGTVFHVQRSFKLAAEKYEAAEQNFRLTDATYGRGVALLALGLAREHDCDHAAAAQNYGSACKAFLELRDDSRRRRDQHMLRVCGDMAKLAKGRADEERRRQESGAPRSGSRRLVLVATARAGPDSYSPDVDITTDWIEMGRTVYKLLNPKGRQPEPVTLRQADEYFEIVAQGDSMVGAGVLPGDRLLVRRQSRVSPRDVAVVQVIDDLSMSNLLIKHIKVEKGRIVLESDNRRYPKRELYPADTWQVTVLGKVVAILQQD